jgi:hypothetical protein
VLFILPAGGVAPRRFLFYLLDLIEERAMNSVLLKRSAVQLSRGLVDGAAGYYCAEDLGGGVLGGGNFG